MNNLIPHKVSRPACFGHVMRSTIPLLLLIGLLFLNLGADSPPRKTQGVLGFNVEQKALSLKNKRSHSQKGEREKNAERHLKYSLLTFPDAQPLEKFRLILLLHPAGDTAENYLKNWQAEAINHRTMIVAPQRTREVGVASPELYNLFTLVEDICAHYPIDQRRIYVAGASAGALIGTWLVQKKPALWRGAIAVAGFGFDDAMVGVPIDEGRFKEYPQMLYVHGWHDTETFRGIQIGIKHLLNSGVRAQLYDYKDAGHEHRPEWNGRIFQWIENVEKQSRDAGDKEKAA